MKFSDQSIIFYKDLSSISKISFYTGISKTHVGTVAFVTLVTRLRPQFFLTSLKSIFFVMILRTRLSQFKIDIEMLFLTFYLFHMTVNWSVHMFTLFILFYVQWVTTEYLLYTRECYIHGIFRLAIYLQKLEEHRDSIQRYKNHLCSECGQQAIMFYQHEIAVLSRCPDCKNYT